MTITPDRFQALRILASTFGDLQRRALNEALDGYQQLAELLHNATVENGINCRRLADEVRGSLEIQAAQAQCALEDQRVAIADYIAGARRVADLEGLGPQVDGILLALEGAIRSGKAG